jgi:tight adherence protein B
MSPWPWVLAVAVGLLVSLVGPAPGIERLDRGGAGRYAEVVAGPLARLRRRRRRIDPQAAARVAEVWCADLSAGRPAAAALADALDAVAATDPRSGDLRAASAAVRLGDDPAQRLGRLAARDDDGWAALAACWSIAERGAGRIAEAVEHVGAGLRLDADLHQELRAQVAGAKSAVRLVAALPLLGPVIGTAVGADPLRVLLEPPVGPALLLLGAALNGIGIVWVRSIVRRAAVP